MPKIRINEYDLTGVVQQSSISNRVYIPCLVASSTVVEGAAAFDPVEVDSVKELKALCLDQDKRGFRIALHLLNSGLPLLVEGIAFGTTSLSSHDWSKLEDKNLYDIRFITSGDFETSGAVDTNPINIAKKRGDCVALCDHPYNAFPTVDEYVLIADETEYAAVSVVYTKTEDSAKYQVVSTKPESFELDKYYYINTATNKYTLLTEKPYDWDNETWPASKYYTKKSGVSDYTQCESKPATFEENKYYEKVSAVTNGRAKAVREYFNAGQSEFAAAFTPWFQVKSGDFLDDGEYIPASFGYLFAYAKSCQSNAEWLAIAGPQRGIISELVGVEYEYGSADVEILQGRAASGEVDLDDDNDNVGFAINPIAYRRPGGYQIYGNRTLKFNNSVKKTTALSFLNVRNLTSAIKKKLFEAAGKYTFEQNSDKLWINFQAYCTPLLDQMVGGDGLLGYKFIKQVTTAKARLTARLNIVPVEGIEDFDLSVYLTDSLEVSE